VSVGKENLFLCMGSACHQLGVYDVLPKLQALIQTHGLTDQVELKGSFCLETCSHGIVMKFHDTCFTNISPHNVEAIFETQILPAIQGRDLRSDGHTTVVLGCANAPPTYDSIGVSDVI
jgi:hypothetical protein